MNRRIVLIAVAVVLAVIGTVAVYSYAHNADKRAVAGGRAVKVVIATKRVAAGTTWADAVKSGNLSVQNVPATSRPDSALSTIDAGVAKTAVAQSDIAPGQVVLRESFGVATPQTGVLAIPKGMIAITVGMSPDADVAGYVVPQSQVIIFVTAGLKVDKSDPKLNHVSTSGDDLTITRTVVTRASVIATSQAAPTTVGGQSGDNSATASSSTSSSSGGSVLVTLALTQKDAERVINQNHIGQLTLGLLSKSSVVRQDGGYVNAGVFRPSPIWVK